MIRKDVGSAVVEARTATGQGGPGEDATKP